MQAFFLAGSFAVLFEPKCWCHKLHESFLTKRIHNLQERAQWGAEPENTRIPWHFTPFKESSSDSLQIMLSHYWWNWDSDLPTFCCSGAGTGKEVERSLKVTEEGVSFRCLRLLDGSQNIWYSGYWSTHDNNEAGTRQSCPEHTHLWETAGFGNRHVLQVKQVLGHTSAAGTEQPDLLVSTTKRWLKRCPSLPGSCSYCG